MNTFFKESRLKSLVEKPYKYRNKLFHRLRLTKQILHYHSTEQLLDDVNDQRGGLG